MSDTESGTDMPRLHFPPTALVSRLCREEQVVRKKGNGLV